MGEKIRLFPLSHSEMTAKPHTEALGWVFYKGSFATYDEAQGVADAELDPDVYEVDIFPGSQGYVIYIRAINN